MTDPLSERREAPPAEQLLEPGQLAVRSEREGGAHCIRVFGELDLATVGAVEEELGRAEAGDAESIVLDLSGLRFMDSTGVRLVVTAAARSRSAGDRLSLVRGPAAVQRVFELSGVADVLPFGDPG
ncbi:MAG: hypothetical protein QOE11_69 [Solirubrobacteraceae bacterium]|jgi:anti-anti-sigma factor|nr:hypothetical protein [Solirubrobacteraceae bacterium]